MTRRREGLVASSVTTSPLKPGAYSVPAVVVVVTIAVVFVRQCELPDGPASVAELWDPGGGADAVGAEVEIAIRPNHVHVGEVEPGRDHRGRPRFGVELDDVAGERLRGGRRGPHVDEVDVALPVRCAAGHVLEVRVGDERGGPAMHAVEMTGQRRDPQPVVRLRDAVRHLIAWESVLPEREIVEDADVPTIAYEFQ